MTVDTLESTITLGPCATVTERDWKAGAAELLQILAVPKDAAEAEAEDLYQSYVTEKGFSDQCFKDDPVGAVMDDRAYWSELTPNT